MPTDPFNSIRDSEKPPIILIHGVAASKSDWIDLTPDLVSAGYKVYALDLLGHGAAIKPKDLKEYNADRVFEHLDDWIKSLNLTISAVLIGHSLGGYLALEYALKFPSKVSGLVLIDGFYSLDQLSPILKAHYRRPLFNLGLISYLPKWLIRLSIELGSLFIRNGYVAPSTKSGRDQVAEDYKNASPGIYNILSTVRDLTPELSKVNIPVLVAWGSHDKSLSPRSFEKLVPLLPNSEAFEIDSGHVPHQSHPEKLNPKIISFLKKLSK